jgi:streptogramin lyase
MRPIYLMLIAALAVTTACSDPEPRVQNPPPGTTCVDDDGDGYGINCDLGLDCDDSDPLRALSCDAAPDAGPVVQPPDHCAPGARLPGCPCAGTEDPVDCYDGEGDTLGVGICHGGSRYCMETQEGSNTFIWSRCEEQQLPRATERCNGLDDNCDGRVDEGVLSSCGNCNPHCYSEGQGPSSGEPFEEPNDDNGSGVGLDEDGNLILNRNEVRFEYLWVANAGEGTISKVDTRELREAARFDSVGPNDDGLTPGSQNSPSRTGIDLNGDMFVANRAFGRQPSVTKIYNRDCNDRNNNGRIETSSDLNGNNVIDRNDPNEFLGQNDECYAWSKAVGRNGGTARALAIDGGDAQNPYGNVWVGMYQHREFYGMQGGSGQLIQRQGLTNPVTIGHSPYGAVVDSNGYVWSGTLSRGTIAGFDSATGRASVLISPQGVPARSYGFTLDGENRLWVGAQNNGVNRYDPYRDANGNPIQDPLAGGGAWRNSSCGGNQCYMRGAGADAEGRIWFADNTSGMIGYRVDNMQLIGQFSIGGGTTGAGVDFNGFIWGVASSGFTGRIDPNNPNDVRRVTVGSGPYTYSDFTGFGLRNFTAPRGGYKMVVEGCEKLDTDWMTLDAEATLPPQTRIEFRAKVAASRDELSDPGLRAYGPWVMSAEGENQLPADLAEMPGGRFMELELFLVSTDREATPVLRGVDVRFQCQIEE